MYESFKVGPKLIYHVPFCAPFWAPTTNLTAGYEDTTLWSLLPNECRSASLAAACVACTVAFCCMVIHIATIVAYSRLRGDILQRKTKSSARMVEKRHKYDLGVIKEAASYAFAMMTQERLRMTLAFTGMFSSALLPVTVASAGIAYSLSYPKSLLEESKSKESLYPYSVTVAAIYHVTLIASFCILLLMIIERYREIRKIHPDRYIKSGKDENGDSFRRSMIQIGLRAVRKQARNIRNDPDVIPKRDETKFGRIQDALLYTFQKSYTFLELVLALVVPLASGIIATVAVVVFKSLYEPYGILMEEAPDRTHTINGLLSYGSDSFPTNVFVYTFTIGLLIVACLIMNCMSLLKCKTLISIAKYLPGYRHSLDLFQEVETENREPTKESQRFPRTGSNAIRVVKVSRNPKISRQDPDGLSSDEPDRLESSMSSIPLPPVPLSRASAVSLDNLSLPPPPRPESMADPPAKTLVLSPSLPSMAKFEEDFSQDPSDHEISEVKAEAFFGNIRQTKVVVAVILVFLLLSAPSMALFTMGAFYSHNEEVTTFMGAFNSTLLEHHEIPPLTTQIMVFNASTPASMPSAKARPVSVAREAGIHSTNRRNTVTTLSSLFMVLYGLASVAPFFVYCAASRKFRQEASRFFCSCISFRPQCCCCKRSAKYSGVVSRKRTNRDMTPSARHSNSFRFSGNLGHKPPVKLIQVQVRRDKPGSRTGNFSTGISGRYETAKL